MQFFFTCSNLCLFILNVLIQLQANPMARCSWWRSRKRRSTSSARRWSSPTRTVTSQETKKRRSTSTSSRSSPQLPSRKRGRCRPRLPTIRARARSPRRPRKAKSSRCWASSVKTTSQKTHRTSRCKKSARSRSGWDSPISRPSPNRPSPRRPATAGRWRTTAPPWPPAAPSRRRLPRWRAPTRTPTRAWYRGSTSCRARRRALRWTEKKIPEFFRQFLTFLRVASDVVTLVDVVTFCFWFYFFFFSKSTQNKSCSCCNSVRFF